MRITTLFALFLSLSSLADRAPSFGTDNRAPSFGTEKLEKSWAEFYPALSLPTPVSATQRTKACPRAVTVAVIDTGIDYTHPALKDSLYVNTGEIADGQDNDQNGFKDDLSGWDFAFDFKWPFDTHGHGTHISGMILGVARGEASLYPKIDDRHGWQKRNYIPVGCKPVVRILSLKYYDNGAAGYNNLKNTVRAINYAIEQNVDVINYSGGGVDSAESERDAIKLANSKGILFVAAAGNDGRSNDRRPYYPASYGFDNIIAVASTNAYSRLLPSTNFGKTVHMAAPGLMIQSTLPGGKTGTMSGSSQSTAYVSGVAALLMTMEPTKDYRKVRDVIFQTAREMKLNESKQLLKHGLIDVEAAVKKMSK